MKIAVVGLGAVGGLLAARLVRCGQEVCAVARGATLHAMRTQGLQLDMDGRSDRIEMPCTDDPRTLGAQDLVIVALKGQALADVAQTLHPLLAPHTLVMPAMNGVPWWFLQAAPAALALGSRRLSSVDPHGRIEAALALEQVLGCVVHLTCSSPEPGRVRHGFGHRLIVGEPAGGDSDRPRSARPQPTRRRLIGSRASPRCCAARASRWRKARASSRPSGTSCGAT